MRQIIKTFSSKKGDGYEITENGDCPTIYIIEENGNEKMQVSYLDYLNKESRNLTSFIKEYIKPVGEDFWMQYTSGLYNNNCISCDDSKYCLKKGNGSYVTYEEAHTEDGYLKPDYCTAYEYYKLSICITAIFPVQLNTMYDINTKN